MYLKYNFLFLLLLSFLLSFGFNSQAQESQKTLSSIMRQYDSDNAAAAKREAKSYSDLAAIKKKQATQYRELEENARQYANDSNNSRDKEQWLKDAERRRAAAKRLDKEAKELLKKVTNLNEKSSELEEKVIKGVAKEAAEKEASDAAMVAYEKKEAAEEAKKRNKNSCQFTKANELIGLWHYNDDTDSNPLAIVEEDPEIGVYPNRLELHNYDRVWKGTFDSISGLNKDKPRITFKYKPKIEEMNKELPDWVVVGMEGQLEWEMEIWPECDDGAVMPHAIFYPGEIVWNEDEQIYRIEGRGEGRRFDLNPVIHMTLESYANAAIGISVAQNQDPFIKPIEALTKRQRFNVMIRLPSDMAKEVGNTIDIQLKGLESGDTDTLTLKSGRASGNNPVLYKHKKAITIADSTDWRENPRRQKFMSLNYLFGEAGDMIDLDVENGEVVQFSYKDLKFEVPVYQSLYQRGNARFKQAANRMRAVFGMVLGGNYTQEQKEAAHKKMRMLLNYEKIIASEHANDRHRYNLGELYFGNGVQSSIGLLQMTEAQIKGAYNKLYENTEPDGGDPINPLMRAALEGMTGKDMSIKSNLAADKVLWTSDTERFSVIKSLRKISIDSRKEVMDIIMKDFSFGMYQGITMATGTDSVYLLATGTDVFGRNVPTWQRVQAALGLASSAVLTVTGTNAVRHFATKRQVNRISIVHKSNKTLRSASAGDVVVTQGLSHPKTPKTLKPTQKKQTYSSAAREALDETEEFAACTSKGGQAAAKTVQEGIERLFDYSPRSPRNAKITKARLQKEGKRYMKKRYPSSAVLIKDEAGTMYGQTAGLPTCQAKVLSRIIKRKTGNEIGELDLHRLIIHLAELDPGRLKVSGRGLIRGYKNWMIRKAGRAFGMKVGEINIVDGVKRSSDHAGVTTNRNFKLRSLRPVLEAGGGIKALLRMRGGSIHAVSVEGLTINKRGFVTGVRLYDSNVPGVLELPAGAFKKMLARDGNITVFL